MYPICWVAGFALSLSEVEHCPMPKPLFTVQRRLAAIFSADVAGYTRLMNADEVGTLRLLTSHREMTDRFIPQHGGRIANTAGDSILAEFPSAVDALRCSLDIQQKVASVNAEVPDERRVMFRIGLHVGEAMIRNGDLFGDGVNVAARMQALAKPGFVCLSAAAHEYVFRIFPLGFEDLGSQWAKISTCRSTLYGRTVWALIGLFNSSHSQKQ